MAVGALFIRDNFNHESKVRGCSELGMAFQKTKLILQTQVRSPAVRLRLALCTAWVKRWSEAMNFLQTIFKTNISKNYDFLLRFKSEAKISRNSRKIMILY